MPKGEIVVSGIRSTGVLHLGNYFGAMRNYVRMQDDYTCFFFIADWHALTTHPDTKELSASVHRVASIRTRPPYMRKVKFLKLQNCISC